jgi:CTP synthase
VAVQFHPEFKSKPLRPHPLFAGFIEAGCEHKRHRLAGEARPVAHAGSAHS